MASNTDEEKTPLLNKKYVSNTRIHLTSSKTPEQDPSDFRAPKPSSCCTNLLYYLSSITVEPALLFHSVSYGIEGVFKTNMILDKTCTIQLQYGQDICDNLNSGNYGKEQDSVQSMTNDYVLYCQWIEFLPAVFMMVLLGAWGDIYGRKIPLFLPLLGSTLKALGLALNAHWWHLPPFYILLSYIPYGLTGNMMAIFMAASAYIGEESGQRSRTTRLSLLNITMFVCIPVGHAVGMYLFNHGGYVLVFGAEFLISSLSVLYILVRIKNKPPKRKAGDSEEETPRLSLARIKQSLLVVFKERENGGRAQVLGHICCISLYVITFSKDSWHYVIILQIIRHVSVFACFLKGYYNNYICIYFLPQRLLTVISVFTCYLKGH